MKRYRTTDIIYAGIGAKPCDDGDWVKWEDVEPLIEEMEQYKIQTERSALALKEIIERQQRLLGFIKESEL